LKRIEPACQPFHLAFRELSLLVHARKTFSDAVATGIFNLALKPRDIPIEFRQFCAAVLDLLLKPAEPILKAFKFGCLGSYASLRAQGC
jgi:hypothetical protein